MEGWMQPLKNPDSEDASNVDEDIEIEEKLGA